MIQMQGLRTADWWFEEQGTYFERVLAQMSALPFADNSFDWVFLLRGAPPQQPSAPTNRQRNALISRWIA
jgi:hypothetical protein